MKVVFLLDNREYVEVAPDKLQIRQIADGQAALGIEVTVPVNKEDGTPELDDAGQPKTTVGFRPFINYAVNLSVPKTAPEAEVAPAAKEVVKAAKNQAKRKASRKAN